MSKNMRLFTHKFSVFLFWMIISSFGLLAQSPTNSKNYVVTKSYTAKMEALAPNYLETDSRKVDIGVMYMDGTGRPVQEIAVQASPSGKDIVRFHEYDNMGREARQYLPFSFTTAPANNGAFLTNPGGFTVNGNGKDIATGEIANFYNSGITGVVTDARPFSKAIFEASPISRITTIFPAGEAFDGTKIITPNVRFNTSANDKVYRIVYSGSPLSNSTTGTQDLTKFAVNTFYADNTLNTSTMIDADGRSGITFTDREGRLVCKRIEMGNGQKAIDTYYVYDDLSQLRCIVTPAAIASIPTATTFPKTFSVLFGTSTKLYYFYDYDELGRVIVKETPKAGSDSREYIVYDQWDRIRCTQDGNQRINNKWSTISYDKLNRPAFTAEVIYNSSATTVYTKFTALQTEVNAINIRYEDDLSTSTIFDFYSYNKTLPTSFAIDFTKILSVNYYDNYNFSKPGFPIASQSSIHSDVMATYQVSVNGKMTGSRKKILGTTRTWKRDVSYYDFDYNTIASAEDLIGIPNSPGGEVTTNNTPTNETQRFLGAYEWTANQFSWDGKAIRNVTEHRGVTSAGIKKVSRSFTYDHESRLLKTTFSATGNAALDSGRVITLANYEYNELGQQRRRTLGDNPNAPIGKQKFAQQFTYAYHIQGMIKEMLGQQFTEKTYYERRKTDVAPANTGYFSGLVSESFWQSGGKPEQGQKFTYDPANRLTSTSGVNFPYSERGINYDNNGNITTLNRVWNNAVIDSLTYNYNANTTGSKIFLERIIDNAPTATRPQGVKTRTNLPSLTVEYQYDANGNLTRDGKRGITTAMTYNILDLVEQISVNSKTVKYQYAADGEKLVTDMGTEKTVYAGAFEYDGSGVVVRVGTGVGQLLREVVGVNAVYRYQYYLQDRLGNTRVVVNETGDTLQRSDYLAYGMQIQYGNSTKNKYLYEGKELQTEMGWLDFGARMYDPTIGRWHAPDPVFQFASPYSYVGGDPINMIDPDGRCAGPGGTACPNQAPGLTPGNVADAMTVASVLSSANYWFSDRSSSYVENIFTAQLGGGPGPSRSGTTTSGRFGRLYRSIKDGQVKKNAPPVQSTTPKGIDTYNGALFELAMDEHLARAIRYNTLMPRIPINVQVPKVSRELYNGNTLFDADDPRKYYDYDEYEKEYEKQANDEDPFIEENPKGPLVYVTYTKYNPETNEIYSGRSRGRGTPEGIVKLRDAMHHMNSKGFGPAILDKVARATLKVEERWDDPSYQAIRGREQDWIDDLGGVRTDKKKISIIITTSGNSINGIYPKSGFREIYLNESQRRYGRPNIGETRSQHQLK